MKQLKNKALNTLENIFVSVYKLAKNANVYIHKKASKIRHCRQLVNINCKKCKTLQVNN